jgi:multiple sugar transport system permease protein
MTATTAPVTAEAAVHTRPSRIRWQRVVLHLFLIVTSLIWLFPILWTLLQALRPYGDVIKDGYVAWPAHLSLQNFATAWEQGDLGHFFRNTLIIAIPAVIGTLFISSMLGFVFARFSFKANILLLMLFTAGNLLPQQVIIVPLYRIYLLLPNPLQFLGDAQHLYDSYFGIAFIHIVFQTGFCTFVLSNYMKTLSKDLTEAALVDGASLWMIYRKVVLPSAGPRWRPRGARVHVHLQRLLLGPDPDVDRRQAAHHLGPQQLPGAFFTDQNVLPRCRSSSSCRRSSSISCSRSSSSAA